MTIRPASSADLPAIMAMERSAPMAAHWSQARYEAILNAPHATDCLIFVIDNGSHLDAFLVARTLTPEWELENIVVAESARLQGLGRQLVTALLDAAREQHAQFIFLEVRESNLPARALYLRCGFHESGRRPAYYNCPIEDAILYTLALS
jgi:[ribosomal protein S18]-alanine N-acetyltransferase